ncbi:MAG TPA: hypothetical protein PLK75_09285 [Bacteroidales bacterium]|nr:hypothetical protein [Bacteroidales bacterium]
MKKLLVSLSLLCFINVSMFSQNCFLLEKGYINKSVSHNYYSDLTSTKGWSKMKPEKKAELINQFNTDVLNGTKAPSSSYFADIYVKDIERGEIEKLTYGLTINGIEYTFPCLCVDNVHYYYRTVGPVYYVSNGDTIGAGFNGTQAIPNNLKVGDILPSYEDISNLIIGTTSYEDKQRVLDGYREVETIEKNATYLSKQTGRYETGTWKVTKYEEVWKDIDVKVLESTALNSHTIHYVNAIVDRTEEVVLDDKTYTAYVIESEMWIQSGFESTFAADNAKWQKRRENFQNRLDNQVQKKLIKSKFLNEEGYYVTYLSEWFIPNIGVVKTITYDSEGCISSIGKWDGLK